MVYVFQDLQRVVTSNVNSATISIIEHVDGPSFGPPPGTGGGPPPPPPPGMPPGAGPRKTWRITNVPAGRGCEGFDVSPDGKEIKFLRRIPMDPMTGTYDWGKRSMQDDPKSQSWGGQNVFDVYTKSTERARDGTPYAEWN